MKILHVETGRFLYGGAQQVLYLVRGLADEGVSNVVVTPPHTAVDKACREQGLIVSNIACLGDHDLRFGFRLARLLRELKPDIVHCHSRRGADVYGGLAAQAASIPALVSRRVDNPEPGWLASFRYRPFRRIVVISEVIASVLRSAGVRPERMCVIYDAVDVERFRGGTNDVVFRQRFGLSSDSFVLGCVAQLIPRKGHRYLLEAISKLRYHYPKLRLIVFGQGPLESQLRRLAANLGLRGAVQFAGYRDDLDDYLGCLDLVVHPALREGLGVATLKAAAAGVPVVGFAAGGLTESVAHGQTGLLVEPGSSVELRQAIAELIDNPGLRRQMGEAGRMRMQSEFSISKMVGKHIQLYQALLQREPRKESRPEAAPTKVAGHVPRSGVQPYGRPNP